MGTASRSVETLPVPPPKAVAKSAGGPTAPGRKRTLSGRKLTQPACRTLHAAHFPKQMIGIPLSNLESQTRGDANTRRQNLGRINRIYKLGKTDAGSRKCGDAVHIPASTLLNAGKVSFSGHHTGFAAGLFSI